MFKAARNNLFYVMFSSLVLLFVAIIVSPSVFTYAADSVQVTIGNTNGSPGSDIEVPIDFSNITSTSNINNCDFTITYDKTKLTLSTVTPGNIIKEPTTDFSYNDVLDTVTQSPIGQVNFLFNDESSDNSKYITDNGNFAKLKFHIKSDATTGSAIQINKNTVGAFCLSDVDLTIRQANFTNGTVTVNAPAVDKSALSAAISAATTLIGSKTVGTAVGNVPQAAKDAFQTVISAAILVANATNATQAQVNDQVTALSNATIAFNNSIIVGEGNIDISIGNVTASPGTIVEVPVTLTQIPSTGISGFTMRFGYDTTNMKYVGIDTIGSIVPTNITLVPNETNSNKIIILGSNSTPSNNPISTKGVLFKIKFQINNNAQSSVNIIKREDSVQVVTKFTNPLDQSIYTNILVRDGAVTVNPIIYGDVTGDGSVDISDYNFLQLYLLESIDKFPGVNGLKAADVTGDGFVDISDYNYVQLYLLESIDKFPATK